MTPPARAAGSEKVDTDHVAAFDRNVAEFREMLERRHAPCAGFIWLRWFRPSRWHVKKHHVDLLCGVSVNRYCVRCGKEGLL